MTTATDPQALHPNPLHPTAPMLPYRVAMLRYGVQTEERATKVFPGGGGDLLTPDEIAVWNHMKWLESECERLEAKIAHQQLKVEEYRHNAHADQHRAEAAEEELGKLQKFKAYVHQRLDDAGVPVDPESPHKAQGCRIGGRLDIVLAAYGSEATELATDEEPEAKPHGHKPRRK